MSTASDETMTSFRELLKGCSKQLIEEDGKTLINFALSVQDDGMIALSLLPYFALYCRSAQEFFGKKLLKAILIIRLRFEKWIETLFWKV